MRSMSRTARLLLACATFFATSVAVIPAAAAGEVFTVDSTADGVDANLADAVCSTAALTCTLRAAVMQANNVEGADTVVVPTGTYTFNAGGGFDDTGTGGDLDVTDDLTITGAGAATTIVEAAAAPYSGADRVIDILGGATTSISGLTLRHGKGFGPGGAIRADGDLTLADAVLSHNEAQQDGPGLYVAVNRTASVSRVTFESNRTTGYTFGGGMAVHGTATVTDSAFYNNAAGEGGGLANFGTTSVDRATFGGNYADYGGGITSGSGNVAAVALTLSNVTFSDNHALQWGGAIRHVWGSAAIGNTTIVRNFASDGGGLSWGHNATSPTVRNTILADNYSSTRVTNCHGSALTSGGSNLESGTTCGFTEATGVSSTDPKVTYLGDHGSDLRTVALDAGSPAIGAGDTAACPAVDARGISRGDACDIGAYEAATELPAPAGVWSWADDFQTGEDPAINPDADRYGNAGVWTYGWVAAGAPAEPYTALSTYGRNFDGYAGHEGWQGSGDLHLWKNASDSDIAVQTRSFLRGETMIGPGSANEEGVVDWTSPIDGIVRIDVALHDRDWGGGDGVSWKVSQKIDGTLSTLASGEIPNGRSAVATGSQLEEIAISAGDHLYLQVGARGNHGWDSTQARMIITQPVVEVSDTAAPTNPTFDTTHVVDAWSNDNTIAGTFAGAVDDTAVTGYSYEWSTSADTLPDTVSEGAATDVPTHTAQDGSTWLHVRTVDAAGNWSEPSHIGPFKIDTTAPAAVTATSTPAPNVWTKGLEISPTITKPPVDGGSPVDAYLFDWTSSAAQTGQEPQTAGVDGAVRAGFDYSPMVTNLPTGVYHYLHVRAEDAAGNLGPTLHYGPFKVDRTAPTKAAPNLTSPPTLLRGQTSTTPPKPQLTFKWFGSDAHSGIASYAVNRRTISTTGASSTLSSVKTTARSFTTTNLGRGKTHCYSITSFDNLRNISIGPERCTVVALDDASFSYTKSWSFKTASGYYLNEYQRTATNGATATTPSVSGKRVHVMYTKCPSCGSFKVYAGGKLLTKTPVATASSGTTKGVQKSWLLSTALKNASVRIEAVLPKGKELRLEGVAVSSVG